MKKRRGVKVAAVVAVLVGAAFLVGGVVVPLGAPSRELVIDLDPFDISPNASHHDVVQPPVKAVALPVDGWLQGYSVAIVDAHGAALPQRMLHHINLIAPQRRELFSPIMLRIGAAGPETAPVKLPALIGVPMRQGDSLLLSAMVHNPTEHAYSGARIRVRISYVAASEARVTPKSVLPFYVDVMPPAGVHDFALPPGRSERFWEGSPSVQGRILAVGGHLHKYGMELRFEDRTAKRVIWRTAAHTNATGEVTGIPKKYFLFPPGETLDPTHVYRLTATYQNPTADTIPGGGMGTLGGVFVPADLKAWPAVSQADPEYQKDVRVTWRLDEDHEMMMPPMSGDCRDPAMCARGQPHVHKH